MYNEIPEISNMFNILLGNETSCCKCGQILSSQSQNYNVVTLSIKENCIVDIKTALESTFCDEIIDFACNHCGHNLASVKNFIATTSDYLVIQLKRFKFISKKQQTKKLFKNILCDGIIELKCCGGRSLYELISVVDHLGYDNQGHYVCNLKINNKRFNTNDHMVTEIQDISNSNSQKHLFIDV